MNITELIEELKDIIKTHEKNAPVYIETGGELKLFYIDDYYSDKLILRNIERIQEV